LSDPLIDDEDPWEIIDKGLQLLMLYTWCPSYCLASLVGLVAVFFTTIYLLGEAGLRGYMKRFTVFSSAGED